MANALVELATAAEPTSDPIPEIAGPQPVYLINMARLVAARGDDPVRVEATYDPADPEHIYESGALLPGPHATLAGPTFEEWLATS